MAISSLRRIEYSAPLERSPEVFNSPILKNREKIARAATRIDKDGHEYA